MFLFFIALLLSTFYYSFFFFNDTATTEIYTLSLHDALPIFLVFEDFHQISVNGNRIGGLLLVQMARGLNAMSAAPLRNFRSEEHTSELQSHSDLVCRLLLEKKKKTNTKIVNATRKKK